ncbi:hypothetical protein [Pararhodobacter aggregans]|uniref:hypothetical protein n=1 Tax=Pararhodobacter aggregans TaxID=404875 RepID=UPI003A8E244D
MPIVQRLPALVMLLVTLLALAGGARAQSGDVTFRADSVQHCFQRCDGACAFAYFDAEARGHNCRWTTETRPNLSVPLRIWSGRHRTELSADTLVDLYPQAVIEFAARLNPSLVAQARARLQQASPSQTDTPPQSSDILLAGANACRARPHDAGRLWIFLYGNINNSRYRENRGFICSESGDRFYVLASATTMERYDCRAHFSDCYRNASRDVYIGRRLGADSQGATERWEITNGPNGSASGALIARF